MIDTVSIREMDFDSEEEREFYFWCKDACDLGIIDDFVYHPESIKLSPKIEGVIPKKYRRDDGSIYVKKTRGVLAREHIYTPDYIITSTHELLPLVGIKKLRGYSYYIDIKGGWNIHNNHREFSINQKWVYQVAKIYVNKVDPKEFFQLTFCPTALTLTEKTKKPRAKFKGCRTTADIAEHIKNGTVDFIDFEVNPGGVNTKRI